MRLSTLSTELVRVPVARDDATDPTADVIWMAFVQGSGNPSSGDWIPASWETVTISNVTTYYTAVLVGPQNGAKVLAAGEWRVWVKITDNPEIPVRYAGILRVF